MTDSPKFDFDKLKMYFREPYTIKCKKGQIVINQPTIDDILTFGEKEFYSMLYVFVSNPTSYRVQLWDKHIDWNKITDYELFCSLVRWLDINATSILFEDVDFSLFKLYTYQDNDSIVITLYNEVQGIEIDEDSYKHIAEYLRSMFNIYPKVEKAKGKTTKEWIIEEEREKLAKAQNESSKSTLLPLISSCINHPGFKYKLNELREVGIVQFMDSVQRLQIYESTVALNSGMYSGMCDLSKVDKKLFNFMRDIDDK